MEFVTFELANKLKEKGFPQTQDNIVAMYNENGVFHALCATIGEEYWYGDFDNKDFVCPTISQVLKWLRENKQIVFWYGTNARNGRRLFKLVRNNI